MPKLSNSTFCLSDRPEANTKQTTGKQCHKDFIPRNNSDCLSNYGTHISQCSSHVFTYLSSSDSTFSPPDCLETNSKKTTGKNCHQDYIICHNTYGGSYYTTNVSESGCKTCSIHNSYLLS